MNHRLSKVVLGVIVLSIPGLHVPDVDARGRLRFPGAALARGAHHSGPVLSREQLRVCVSEQNSLNAEGDNLNGAQTALKAKAAEIRRLESIIKRREPLVDQYSQQSVDSFNALIGKYKPLVAAYNNSLPGYNAKFGKFKVAQDSFNAKCAGHAYYESDMQAVLAGKQ